MNPWDYAERGRNEQSQQTALFMWAAMAASFGIEAANDPASYSVKGWAASYLTGPRQTGTNKPAIELKWLHAIHNQGHGDKVRGAQAKAAGVRAGVADMFLPCPRAGHAGFYLELKVGSNKPDERQLEFLADMRAAGYAAEWATGWIEAREKIIAYLEK